MLDRMQLGDVPRKHHIQLRGPGGELRYEECFTRDGFDGPYTILYHQRRPHTHRIATPAHGWPAPAAPAALARRHYRSQSPSGRAAVDARVRCWQPGRHWRAPPRSRPIGVRQQR
jgi:homogentisate 1,2-dioxygenase